MISRYQQSFIAFKTILRREVARFMRVWIQTVLPPAITMTLYFMVFGRLMGERIGEMDGYAYIQFIVPGLILMSVITNSYANVVSSFFGAKFQRNIEELLISPTSNTIILIGFIAGGVVRGILVGLVVAVIGLLFTHLKVHHAFIIASMVTLSAVLFSLAGFTNAIFARKFDDISIIPTFVLAPLTYLGGVFYSVDLLPSVWRHISMVNPILYMVNAFRYGILGVSDVSLVVAYVVVSVSIAILYVFNMYLLNTGRGIRS